jgi:hypothetical protein
MPLFYFRISTGRFFADTAFEVADRDAAWVEMTKVCGDLVGSISRQLKQNAEWQWSFWRSSKSPCLESASWRRRSTSIYSSGVTGLFDEAVSERAASDAIIRAEIEPMRGANASPDHALRLGASGRGALRGSAIIQRKPTPSSKA